MAPSMSRIPPREAHSPEEEDGSSPSPNKTASPLSVSLERLPADFSFSRYLSQQALTIASRPFCITLNNAPLADAHLILLALNEECRILRRGSFYHVPLRSNMTKGHPCDLVFVDERWGDKGNARWDGSDWKQRLDMCDATRKMRHSETVLALRTRILKVDLPAPFQGHEMSHPYVSIADPAVAKHANVIAYSLPLEDQSRVALIYPNHHSAPFLWPVDVTESRESATTFPTPNDMSETVLLHWQLGMPVFGHESVLGADIPRKWTELTSALQGPLPSNRDVVLNLLHVWNGGCPDIVVHGACPTCLAGVKWAGVFENVKDRWQDVEKRIGELDVVSREVVLKSFWPTM